MCCAASETTFCGALSCWPLWQKASTETGDELEEKEELEDAVIGGEDAVIGGEDGFEGRGDGSGVKRRS